MKPSFPPSKIPRPASAPRAAGSVLGLLAGLTLLSCLRAHADTLYVSSVNGGKIYRVTTNGTVTAFATINLLPEGLAFNSSGVLFVANDGANSVNRVSTSGFVSTFGTNVTQPYGLGFDSQGNLYAASQSSPAGRVRKITPQGSVTNFGPSISAPYGLAVDQADNVYVASMGTSRIYKIAPDGSSSYFGPPVNSPQGIAFDRKGNLFVAASSGTITKITPAGAGSTFASGLGSSLVGLAFDNEGNLYAANYISGTVWKITAEGTATALATVPGNPSFIAVFPPPAFDPGTITLTPLGSDLVLSWKGNFVLQTSTNVAGPYEDMLGAHSPYTNAASGADMGFFRLKK